MDPGIGQRIRTARAYAGLNQSALAEILEIGEQTEKRIELGKRPAKRSELLAIAEACDVPMWFLERGWDGWQERSIDELGRAAVEDIEGARGARRAAGD